MTCAKCECLVRLKNKRGYNLYYCGYKKYGVLKALSGLYINNEEYRKDNKTCKYYKGGQKKMTDEEILNKIKETSGGNYAYEQGFVYGFELGEENGRKELEKENAELKMKLIALENKEQVVTTTLSN